ncbi:MAG: SDR family NAD(P)-dependent oxidoreductase [Gaiellaceae bacterium]
MLDGKVALVTGAAGGIGRVLVDRLVQAGSPVVPVDIEEADVTNPADVPRMITRAEAEHGGLVPIRGSTRRRASASPGGSPRP